MWGWPGLPSAPVAAAGTEHLLLLSRTRGFPAAAVVTGAGSGIISLVHIWEPVSAASTKADPLHLASRAGPRMFPSLP